MQIVLVKRNQNKQFSSYSSRILWVLIVMFTCNGVPVSNNRFSVWNFRIVLLSRLFSFFKRCASSTTRYFHWNRLNAELSAKHISYVVKQTSHDFRLAIELRVSARAALSPMITIGLSEAQNRFTSLYQLLSVDFGPTTKNGPSIFLEVANRMSNEL